jgi:hypothetical protein
MAKGGGGVWVAGSYDPELNLVFYGTGNPNPAYFGQDRLGDNLYTSSLVALDADTGKLRWHYQFTPHDLHDWDAAQVPVLATLKLKQGMTKVVMQANRNGLFYVLDRATGKCCSRGRSCRRRGRRALALMGVQSCRTTSVRRRPVFPTIEVRPIFLRPRTIPPAACSSSRHAKRALFTRRVRPARRLPTGSP